MTETDYYNLLITEQEGRKHDFNYDFEKYKKCFTTIYNTTYKTLLVLYEDPRQLSTKTLHSNVKLGLFYRLLSLYTSTLKLLEYGYLNDTKALLRITLETTELQTHFKYFENDTPKWLEGEYNMKYITKKLKTIQKLPPSYTKLYSKYSGQGAHLFPPNLLSFFDHFGENIRHDLNNAPISIELLDEGTYEDDQPITIEEFEELLKMANSEGVVISNTSVNIVTYDPEICSDLYSKLIIFMCLNLVLARDYLSIDENVTLYNQVEEALFQAYGLLELN
ncbi:MAG: hypothetical protein ACTSW1_09090 [Candidatus Hodarchaeales archaeon]